MQLVLQPRRKSGFSYKMIRNIEFTVEYDFSVCKKQRRWIPSFVKSKSLYDKIVVVKIKSLQKVVARAFWLANPSEKLKSRQNMPKNCHFFYQFNPLNQYFHSGEMCFQSFNINVNDVCIKNGGLKLNF